jgi:hypothetical protein
MANYPSITDKTRSMVRSGEIIFVSARLECNPETGAARPWEIIKTTSCGIDFRCSSWASEAKARERLAQHQQYFNEKFGGAFPFAA